MNDTWQSRSEIKIRDELKKFYQQHELGADGGVNQKFAKVKLGWLYVYIPNTASRKRAIFFHDVHHLATGYSTDLRSEAEIGAWELGSGCRDFVAAWVLNGLGAALGLLIAPRRTIRAFCKGRKCINLYHGVMTIDEIRESTTGEIRQVLGL